MFLILCDNWKTFFIKVYRYPEVLFNRYVVALFEANNSKEVQNNSAMLIPKFQNEPLVTLTYLLNFLNCFSVFDASSTFFFMNEMFLKNS